MSNHPCIAIGIPFWSWVHIVIFVVNSVSTLLILEWSTVFYFLELQISDLLVMFDFKHDLKLPVFLYTRIVILRLYDRLANISLKIDINTILERFLIIYFFNT